MADAAYTGKRIRPGVGGVANVLLTLFAWTEGYSFKCILNSIELDSVIPQTQALTFCNETAPEFDPGTETLSFRFGGWGTYDDVRSTPFIPPPQNVPAIITLATACTVTGNLNFSRGTFRRVAGGSAVITGEGVVNGAYVLAWDITPPQ
jgi:hypothetical protein